MFVFCLLLRAMRLRRSSPARLSLQRHERHCYCLVETRIASQRLTSTGNLHFRLPQTGTLRAHRLARYLRAPPNAPLPPGASFSYLGGASTHPKLAVWLGLDPCILADVDVRRRLASPRHFCGPCLHRRCAWPSSTNISCRLCEPVRSRKCSHCCFPCHCPANCLAARRYDYRGSCFLLLAPQYWPPRPRSHVHLGRAPHLPLDCPR